MACLLPTTAAPRDFEALVAEHPYREPFWAQLITPYYLAERQYDALDACRRPSDDDTVGRYHAVIVDTWKSFVITDRRSGNGVDVAGSGFGSARRWSTATASASAATRSPSRYMKVDEALRGGSIAAGEARVKEGARA